MSWEGRNDWKSHKELQEACSELSLNDLSGMLSEDYRNVSLTKINKAIHDYNKGLLKWQINTSIDAFNKLK